MTPAEVLLRVENYDLAATLESGQVFRWQRQNESWFGVVGQNYVRLTQTAGGIVAETSAGMDAMNRLRDFLQIDTDLAAVLKTFPDDKPMRAAVAACPGLRLLRQDPWECLASFILSSTKQIVQIRQIVSLLCERFGEPCGGVPAERRKTVLTDKCGLLPKAATPALPVAFPSPSASRTTTASPRASTTG